MRKGHSSSQCPVGCVGTTVANSPVTEAALSEKQREIVPIPMLQSADPATMTAQLLALDGVTDSYGAGLVVHDPETGLEV